MIILVIHIVFLILSLKHMIKLHIFVGFFPFDSYVFHIPKVLNENIIIHFHIFGNN